MRKLIGWIVFVLGVLGLTWWANGHDAKDIETEVSANADEILGGISEGGQRLTASVAGRDITVEGEVLKSNFDNIKDQLDETTGNRVVHMDAKQFDSFGPKFTANFDKGTGLALSGFATSDIDGAGVAKILGVEKFNDEMTQTASGKFEKQKAKLAAIAPDINSQFQTAKVEVNGQNVSLTGTVGEYVNVKQMTKKMKDALGKDSKVEITKFTAPDGTKRTNLSTGQNEVFTNGYWLPDFDFQATLAECQARTDDILKNYKITFVTGGSDLDAESREAIDRVSGVLRHCLGEGKLTLELAGHTDSDGNPEANLALSQARANAVVKAIKTRGIATDDVNAKGYGDTQPIASNNTAEGKQANRRTTITWANK